MNGESWWRGGLSGARRLPLLLQSEASECGLACLAMVAGYWGQHTELAALRRRFALSMKGSTLKELLQLAAALGLQPRALKLPLEHLPQLRRPCILHWDMNHFVVLKTASARNLCIHDPATGLRKLRYGEASRHFTGVAL